MEIRKANLRDIPCIMKLYEQGRKFMREQGNKSQWEENYPSRTLIESDIAMGNSYLCLDQDSPCVVFYYREGEDPSYAYIEDGSWLDHTPYGVVHRIASSQSVRGAASYCLEWAFEQCGNLRIDTHKDNIPMQRLLQKNGFIHCGTIYVEDHSKRMAYQKKLQTSSGG